MPEIISERKPIGGRAHPNGEKLHSPLSVGRSKASQRNVQEDGCRSSGSELRRQIDDTHDAVDTVVSAGDTYGLESGIEQILAMAAVWHPIVH